MFQPNELEILNKCISDDEHVRSSMPADEHAETLTTATGDAIAAGSTLHQICNAMIAGYKASGLTGAIAGVHDLEGEPAAEPE
jgi:hypothetical protein